MWQGAVTVQSLMLWLCFLCQASRASVLPWAWIHRNLLGSKGIIPKIPMCHREQKQGQPQRTQNQFHEPEVAWQRWQCILGCQQKEWVSLWCSLAFQHPVGLISTRLAPARWSCSNNSFLCLLIASLIHFPASVTAISQESPSVWNIFSVRFGVTTSAGVRMLSSSTHPPGNFPGPGWNCRFENVFCRIWQN